MAHGDMCLAPRRKGTQGVVPLSLSVVLVTLSSLFRGQRHISRGKVKGAGDVCWDEAMENGQLTMEI